VAHRRAVTRLPAPAGMKKYQPLDDPHQYPGDRLITDRRKTRFVFFLCNIHILFESRREYSSGLVPSRYIPPVFLSRVCPEARR
jgi:hypothetical protein